MSDLDFEPAQAETQDSGWRLLHAQCPVCGHTGVISNRVLPEHKVTCSHCGARAAMSTVAQGLVGLARHQKSRTRPRRHVKPVAE
jgi:hypothetical protein